MTGDLLSEALDLVHGYLTDYVVFPTPEAADALTIWVAATHLQRRWEHATRFILKSPVKRCGKTRAQEIVSHLVYKPLIAGSITAAALVRTIEDDPPTLILDEADTILDPKRSSDETSEALRRVLNLGFGRNRPWLRWDARKRELEVCPTFAMACIAAIGDLPDTIEDRGIVVVLQRRAPGERVKAYRQSDASGLHSVRNTLTHALKLSDLGRLDSYEPPTMPVEDRAADCWEPLFVVANAAGGAWPARIEKACLLLATEDEGETSLSLRLLSDLASIWGDDEEHLATATILERLGRIEESPWADYFGRPLSARDLARLLRLYQVRPNTVRLAATKTAKGYSRADLYPVWTRYTTPVADPDYAHDLGEASQASQASQRLFDVTQIPALTRDVTDVTDVTLLAVRAQDGPSQGDTETSQVCDECGLSDGRHGYACSMKDPS